jgi:amidase
VTRALREAGRGISHAEAMACRESLAGRLASWWGDADLLVSPTVACAAPETGIGRGDDPAAVLAHAVPLAVFTAAFNASGQPAASIPVRAPDRQPPLGVQLAARAGADALLLSVLRRLEQELGGFDLDPPGWE